MARKWTVLAAIVALLVSLALTPPDTAGAAPGPSIRIFKSCDYLDRHDGFPFVGILVRGEHFAPGTSLMVLVYNKSRGVEVDDSGSFVTGADVPLGNRGASIPVEIKNLTTGETVTHLVRNPCIGLVR